MSAILASLFGIVQGITEFLPISSSGHLIFLHALAPSAVPDTVAFDVSLHVGTLLALFVVFWRDLWRMLLGALRSLAHIGQPLEADARLAWQVVLGTLPVLPVGIFFKDTIENTIRAPWLVATLLLVVGVAFVLVDRRRTGATKTTVTFRIAFLIGLAQALALVPGVSRSGITILVALLLGLRAVDAARFSFLLSVPAVLGAAIVAGADLHATGFGGQGIEFVIGMVSAAIVGALVIRWLLRYFTQRGLSPFGWYRIALGLVVLAVVAFTV
jgi:undecaprenyl-diphosphatase